MGKPSVLLIEQDAVLMRQYALALGVDFFVLEAPDAQVAIDELDDEAKPLPRAIIVDLQLGFNNGVELLHEIRSYDDWLDIPVVIVNSAPPHRVQSERLAKYGVVRTWYKPQMSLDDLVHTVREATRAAV